MRTGSLGEVWDERILDDCIQISPLSRADFN